MSGNNNIMIDMIGERETHGDNIINCSNLRQTGEDTSSTGHLTAPAPS